MAMPQSQTASFNLEKPEKKKKHGSWFQAGAYTHLTLPPIGSV
jgi:hypothetical protein